MYMDVYWTEKKGHLRGYMSFRKQVLNYINNVIRLLSVLLECFYLFKYFICYNRMLHNSCIISMPLFLIIP